MSMEFFMPLPQSGEGHVVLPLFLYKTMHFCLCSNFYKLVVVPLHKMYRLTQSSFLQTLFGMGNSERTANIRKSQGFRKLMAAAVFRKYSYSNR